MAHPDQPRPRRHEWFLTAPSFLWLLILFILPCLLIFAVAFRPPTAMGGIGEGWTLRTWQSILDPGYLRLVLRTLWLSATATLAAILLAVPTGYTVARASPRLRDPLLLLIILPFWTSFLVRVFAWKALLHPEGAVKHLLVWLGLVGPDAVLLYRTETVLLVMIYSYLPFAILPIYAAAERFDFALIEAARDLGAHPLRAFISVFLPGIRQGLHSAVLMVFVPALGVYVIPDIMGGASSETLGTKIAQRTFVDRNLPQAAALSAALTGIVLLFMAAAVMRSRDRDTAVSQAVGGET